MKISKLFAIISLALVLFSSTVLAVADFSVDYVKVDGVVAGSGSSVFVERGTSIPVEVYVRGRDALSTDSSRSVAYDTRVRAYIGGYEYGDVQALSPIFEVESGTVYPVRLVLNVPYDLEASDDYTLNIEVFDDDNTIRSIYTLRVQETRHLVRVFDTIFNPVDNVQAGQYLFATVRVENFGDNLEDTAKVTLSVPSLNLQTSQFVGDLITQQHLNAGGDLINTRRVSATTNELALLVPENTPEGDYNFVVTVDYNRGYGSDVKTYTMHVNGATPEVITETVNPLTINVDSSAQKVNQGQGAQFKFLVSNLAQTAKTFEFEVTGASDWAAFRVDPAIVTVQPNAVGEANIFVAPLEGVEGVKTLTVKVKSNGNVLAEKTLSVESVKVASGAETAKKVLAVIFIVLLVVLVVLAIAVIVKKLT